MMMVMMVMMVMMILLVRGDGDGDDGGGVLGNRAVFSIARLFSCSIFHTMVDASFGLWLIHAFFHVPFMFSLTSELSLVRWVHMSGLPGTNSTSFSQMTTHWVFGFI